MCQSLVYCLMLLLNYVFSCIHKKLISDIVLSHLQHRYDDMDDYHVSILPPVDNILSHPVSHIDTKRIGYKDVA